MSKFAFFSRYTGDRHAHYTKYRYEKNHVTDNSKGSKLDAITLLTEDHNKVKKMFKEYETLCKKDDTEGKEALAMQIRQALTVQHRWKRKYFIERSATPSTTMM